MPPNADYADTRRLLLCEDCGDPTERRIRCKRCLMLLCSWCFHHGLHVRTLSPNGRSEP